MKFPLKFSNWICYQVYGAVKGSSLSLALPNTFMCSFWDKYRQHFDDIFVLSSRPYRNI